MPPRAYCPGDWEALHLGGALVCMEGFHTVLFWAWSSAFSELFGHVASLTDCGQIVSFSPELHLLLSSVDLRLSLQSRLRGCSAPGPPLWVLHPPWLPGQHRIVVLAPGYCLVSFLED